MFIRECCGRFYPKEVYNLDLKNYSGGLLEVGFCPHCGNFICVVGKKDYNREWHYQVAKRKQALKLYEEYKNFISEDLTYKKQKYGNRSNMGFRYGLNLEIKNSKREVIGTKQYSVDFNGSKELIKFNKAAI